MYICGVALKYYIHGAITLHMFECSSIYGQSSETNKSGGALPTNKRKYFIKMLKEFV